MVESAYACGTEEFEKVLKVISYIIDKNTFDLPIRTLSYTGDHSQISRQFLCKELRDSKTRDQKCRCVSTDMHLLRESRATVFFFKPRRGTQTASGARQVRPVPSL